LLAIFLLSFVLIKAETKTATGNTGQGWSVASNWSPSGVPQSGDVVIIPAAFTITVKNTIYSSPFPSLTIKVFGTLDFDPSGRMDLASTAVINIYPDGRIISNGTSSELVNIGGATKFNGQIDGIMNGPTFASSATGTSPNGFNAGVLAIKISSFNYQLVNNQIKLNWMASYDNPNDKFQVQRNTGNGWTALAELSVTGNMNSLNNYSFVDPDPAKAVNLYRIKLLNADAQENYSKTIAVNLLSNIESLSVFPNPAGSSVMITWKNIRNDKPLYVQVNNASMSLMVSEQISAGENSFNLDLGKFPSGLYTITVTNHTDIKEMMKLVVND
jgi:hypothetical protein